MKRNPLARIATGVAVAWAVASPARAQDVRQVTLEEALALFGTSNLDLRLARAEAAEAAALARQAGAFPNPTLAAAHEQLSGDRSDYHESYATLSQRLEWPGSRAARSASAEHAAQAARARFAADSARLAFDVKRAYTEAARATRAERLLTRAAAVFRDGERSADTRYREGDISRYDRARIRVERLRYEALLADAELEAAGARRALALLVAPQEGDLELAPVDALDAMPPAVPAVVPDLALERRGELAAADASLAAARADRSLALAERIPDLVASAGYKRQSDGFSGLVLGLSLPLPVWDRGAGSIQAADARLAAAESRVALARRQVEIDVRRTAERFRVHARRAALITDRGAADETDLLAMAQVAYDEGELELIELLDAADATREAGLAEARLRADLWIAYFDLERAIGGLNRIGEGEDER